MLTKVLRGGLFGLNVGRDAHVLFMYCCEDQAFSPRNPFDTNLNNRFPDFGRQQKNVKRMGNSEDVPDSNNDISLTSFP